MSDNANRSAPSRRSSRLQGGEGNNPNQPPQTQNVSQNVAQLPNLPTAPSTNTGAVDPYQGTAFASNPSSNQPQQGEGFSMDNTPGVFVFDERDELPENWEQFFNLEAPARQASLPPGPSQQAPSAPADQTMTNPVHRLPRSLADARQYLNVVRFQPTLSAAEALLPQNDNDRQRYVNEIARALGNTNNTGDSQSHPDVFQRFSNPNRGGKYSNHDIVAIAWIVVDFCERLYKVGFNGTFFKSFEINDEDKALDFPRRIAAFCRYVSKFKNGAEHAVNGRFIKEMLAEPQLYMKHANQGAGLWMTNRDRQAAIRQQQLQQQQQQLQQGLAQQQQQQPQLQQGMSLQQPLPQFQPPFAAMDPNPSYVLGRGRSLSIPNVPASRGRSMSGGGIHIGGILNTRPTNPSPLGSRPGGGTQFRFQPPYVPRPAATQPRGLTQPSGQGQQEKIMIDDDDDEEEEEEEEEEENV
ncbi:hypothetical protein EJ04DRAFT_568210 [Polyplosphaeria fusca]|uniref:Uncharacterized protein n=1 Tax=Polyplosphaeria fusca TaxID=682080 RepID=A0A9P4QQQ8_9PLEO|nr:hypothetical protein EJ04DRAFT_568210 [Polyplosphaeria fusca]